MIVEFSVKNFGAIKERQILSFEADKDAYLEDYYVIKSGKYRLLKFMLLYGANASGKTTILKAMDYLRELAIISCDNKNQTLDFKPYLLDETSKSEDSEMEIKFIVNKELYCYSIVFNSTYIVSELLTKGGSVRPKTIFKRESDKDKQLTFISFNKTLSVKKSDAELMTGNTLWNSSALSGYLKTNIHIEELQNVSQWFIFYMSSIITPRLDLTKFVTSNIDEGKINKEFVLSLLKQADFNIKDILIKTEDVDIPENVMRILMSEGNMPDGIKQKLSESEKKIETLDIKFVHENELGASYELPLELESLGTHRYYGLAGILSLMYNNSSAFCIDELESSLHPDLFKHFILLFLQNVKSSQCIATTHNREILGDKNLFRNDAIWITDKQEGCDTKLYSLAHFDSSVIRNTTSILNAYKAGRLGGTPDLGDLYIEKD